MEGEFLSRRAFPLKKNREMISNMNMNRQQRRVAEKEQERRQKFSVLLQAANSAVQNLQYDEAARLFGKALQFDPDNVQVMYSQGQSYVLARKYDLAVEVLKNAVLKNPGIPELQKELGLSLRATGRLEEAVSHLRDAIRRRSDMADAHFALAMIALENPDLLNIDEVNESIDDRESLCTSYATILLDMHARRQNSEMALCLRELCRLRPNDKDLLTDLAVAQVLAAKHCDAAKSILKAIRIDDSPVRRNIFAIALAGAFMHDFDPEIKQTILTCITAPYDTDPQLLCNGWTSILFRDPTFAKLAEMISAENNEKVFNWLDNLDEDSAAPLQDPFFLAGLRFLTLPNPLLERFLTQLRKYLCLNFEALKNTDRLELFEPFLFAFAAQCFFNEFVFYESQEERNAIAGVISKYCPHIVSAIALSACYEPLHVTFSGYEQELRKLSMLNPDFRQLMKLHWDDYREEQALKKSLRSFGAIKSQVSRAVRSQYEENPYPRWIGISIHPSPFDTSPVSENLRHKDWKILIAGCGTGRQALSAIARHPNAHVTAIDFSGASLGYAARKAKEAGISSKIEFVQTDILCMSEWPERFDMIECSGVLHHMQDPFAGWAILVNLLKVNGYMNIGLYSEDARAYIVEANKLIKAKGYKPTPDDIREFRQYIFSLPKSHSLYQNFISSNDFYATSLVRDLAFHVQEHRFNLLQIDSMMKRLGLEMQTMIISRAEIVQAYRSMFPTDNECRSLRNWHAFELSNPHTFGGMYNFWCKKIV